MSRVPEAVRKAAEAADAFIAANGSPVDDGDAQPQNTVSQPPKPAAPAPGSPRDDDASWEQRYRVLKGKYDNEVPQLNAELADARRQLVAATDRIAQLEELVRTRPVVASSGGAPQPQVQPPAADVDIAELTQDEIDRFGPDLVDVMKRISAKAAATAAGAKPAAQPQAGNEQAEVLYFAKLDSELAGGDGKPTWRELNRDPRFITWLNLPYKNTGFTRFQVITAASERFEADTVVGLFKDFMAETSDKGRGPRVDPDQVTQPPAGGGEEHGGPSGEVATVTTLEISDFYNAVRQGKYRGREKDAIAMEQKINAAIQAGKVVAKKKR